MKFLHALTLLFLLLNFYFWSKFSTKNDIVSAWRDFKNIFPRPLFFIIFRPDVLRVHPYSILTGDTRVEFVNWESKFDFFLHFSISDLHSDNLQETELIKPVANLINNPHAEFVLMPTVTRTIHKNVCCVIPCSTNFVKRNGKKCSL